MAIARRAESIERAPNLVPGVAVFGPKLRIGLHPIAQLPFRTRMLPDDRRIEQCGEFSLLRLERVLQDEQRSAGNTRLLGSSCGEFGQDPAQLRIPEDRGGQY